MKKFGRLYEPNPVGTRCSASVLGLPSRTRSSASLPLSFLTAAGGGPSGLGVVCEVGNGPPRLPSAAALEQ